MERVKNFLNASADLKYKVAETLSEQILQAANQSLESIRKGGKLMLAGNGGSAADCQHIAAELTGRFKQNRKALAAMALTVDTSSLTALGNDFGFETIFSRQVEALGKSGDVLIGISTSGNSENVVQALLLAREMGIYTIGFIGNQGGKMKDVVDLPIIVPSNDTARIQEVHITIGHIVCEIIEQEMFGAE
ncbi:MAG: D-sedoheptulose 7-phosphate isomerase [Candidatus Nitrohelix vancouverensis]|uniref:Phosphoheptose isomerase n=1 Tax=Candidatus Nitrohelix vancouverensis TaxID=2705534 RepID=A0A7T0G262_9BACT|nr:MAG: D-sedoheptulose 7-phosphate isomerase [Candidatus Nitrohelix vancouverensis]